MPASGLRQGEAIAAARDMATWSGAAPRLARPRCRPGGAVGAGRGKVPERQVDVRAVFVALCFQGSDMMRGALFALPRAYDVLIWRRRSAPSGCRQTVVVSQNR